MEMECGMNLRKGYDLNLTDKYRTQTVMIMIIYYDLSVLILTNHNNQRSV